ncbi:hypothetical protein [Arthrobacter livingstonensis]|uniref:hypothetical protein n=1 Tax=Arthrobacter livingstonensis TaxID=670078 RepID=UPI0011B4B4A2|nr:hypothetical protein [Arthrobacter livingstonensis]
MTVVAGLILPQFDPVDEPGHWWVPGFVASIVFAVATPLAFTLVVTGRLLKQDRKLRWLVIGSGFLAILSVAASSLMLSYGSRYGASGDIGGTPMWLLSTGGLLAVTLVASWSVPQQGNLPGRR